MNRDEIKGKFKQLQGKAKNIWGELTDDDFKKAEGNRDKLVGIIQERYGESKEAIERKLDSYDYEDRPGTTP